MKVLIIGGNATGMSAATRLRKNMPDAEITVLEQGTLVSFGACGLPYFIGEDFNNPNEMIARPLAAFQKNNIDVKLFHKALKLDPTNKKVTAQNIQTDEIQEFVYDKLIISTGAHPFKPDIPGINLEGVFTLTKMHDGIALKEAMRVAKKIVIIGGGFIGLEVAESLTHQNKNVTLIERGSRLSSRVFDPEMTEHLENKVKNSILNLQLNENVIELKKIESILQVITDKASYNADLVIVAIGFVPSTKWCNDIGLRMLPNGAIIIDEYGQTSLPDIYSGGDCASVKNAVLGQDSYIPLATSANKLGRIIGDNIAGKNKAYQGTLGSSALRFMDFQIARTGLSEHEAQSLSLNYGTNLITDFDHTSYVPNKTELHIKLIYDKDTRVLLGGQICGEKGAVLRTDILAVAVYKKMTVEELGMMDLIYAPPFSRTWDALNIAGNTCK